MRKIGIITLNGYFNYGNRLQNYALQETLRKYNYQVDTIWVDNIRRKEETNKNVKSALKSPKKILKKIYKKIYLDPLNNQRELRFKEFSRKYINEHSIKIAENNLPEEFLSQYEYFVTGSDQVWNPHFTKGSPLYHLTFAPKHKRIAYAPSFGVSEIPKEYSDDFKQWLSEMEHLSVREEAGANIIKLMTRRDASVVADPTMLLTKEEWLKIAKPAENKPKEEILLTYYLGQLPEETQKFIEQYAQKFNLKVVNLAKAREKEYYLTDPSEFLDYINSAKLFVTDSFHGAVFSILFETPFVVTNRAGSLPSMNSRIDTLLSTYKLEERHIQNIKGNALEINYSYVRDIIRQERERAFKYLSTALTVEKTVEEND